MTNSRSKPRGTPILAAVLAVAGASAADCEPGTSAQAAQAQQKIKLLEKLTSDSEPLRRLQQGGDEVALATLDNAVAITASARQALADGCQADAAALSNEALRLVTEAFRSPSNARRDAQIEFKAELDNARSLFASLQGRPAAESGLDAETLSGIERQIRNAEALAASGSVDEAQRLLVPVSDRLQRRLLEMFDQRTLYYEHIFESPADEFAYLQQQYDGYLMLLSSGDRTTPYSARQRVTSLLQAAADLHADAQAHESAGAWAEAIAAMNAALEHCARATTAMGYTY